MHKFHEKYGEAILQLNLLERSTILLLVVRDLSITPGKDFSNLCRRYAGFTFGDSIKKIRKDGWLQHSLIDQLEIANKARRFLIHYVVDQVGFRHIKREPLEAILAEIELNTAFFRSLQPGVIQLAQAIAALAGVKLESEIERFILVNDHFCMATEKMKR